MAEEKFKIVKELFYIQEDDGYGNSKELNLVEWYGRKGKYDIRVWKENHTIPSKGIVLTEEEFKELILFGIGHLGLSLKEGITNVNV